MENQRLVIIGGANKGIGKGFADRFEEEKNTIVHRISRTGTHTRNLDLSNTSQIDEYIQSLQKISPQSIIYFHSIGIDKFEPDGKPEIDEDKDGIDDEVFKTNYQLLRNFADPLIEITKTTQTPLTLCTIGSISDSYNVPFWQSFSQSKNKVRQFFKSIPAENISRIMLNVSSVLGENNETYGRENIDTKYWLTIDELVKKAFPIINQDKKRLAKYTECDFYKHNPHFKSDYFTQKNALYKKWQKDLGYENQKIPHGIRI